MIIHLPVKIVFYVTLLYDSNYFLTISFWYLYKPSDTTMFARKQPREFILYNVHKSPIIRTYYNKLLWPRECHNVFTVVETRLFRFCLKVLVAPTTLTRNRNRVSTWNANSAGVELRLPASNSKTWSVHSTSPSTQMCTPEKSWPKSKTFLSTNITIFNVIDNSMSTKVDIFWSGWGYIRWF